jgi:hypothetical protein
MGAVLGFSVIILGSSDVNGQTRRQIERERQRIEKEQRKIAKENARSQRNRRNDRQLYDRGRVPDRSVYAGYQNSLLAGEFDRRKGKFNQSNVYRNTGVYPAQGDPTSSDYLYRQGYLEGYEDGFYGRRRY